MERYDPAIGQPFDPNLHSALFDVPDPTKENNTIAIVTKVCAVCFAVSAPWQSSALASSDSNHHTRMGHGACRTTLPHCAPDAPQRGYKLNERIVRPAEVGVVKNSTA